MKRSTLLLLLLAVAAGRAAALEGEDRRPVFRLHPLPSAIPFAAPDRRPGLERFWTREPVPRMLMSVHPFHPLDSDMLVDHLTQGLPEAGWNGTTRSLTVHHATRSLSLKNTPAVQDQVHRLLNTLRRHCWTRVGLAVEAWDVDSAWLHGPGSSAQGLPFLCPLPRLDRRLAAGKAKGLARCRDRITLGSLAGRRVSGRRLRAGNGIRDFDIEVASGVTINDPLADVFLTGLAVDASTVSIEGGRAVLLDLFLDWALPVPRPWPRPETGRGPVDGPRRRRVSLRTSALVPRDHALCLPAPLPGAAGRTALVCLRPSVQTPVLPLPRKTDGPHLAFHAVPLLLFRPFSYAGPSLGARPYSAEWPRPWTKREDFLPDPEPLVDLVRENVLNRAPALQTAYVQYLGSLLGVYHNRAVQKRVAAFLGERRRERGRTVAVDLCVFSLPSERAASLAPVPGPLSPPALADLIARLASAPLAARAGLVCFDGQRAHVASLVEWPVLLDADPEVAKATGGCDPVLGLRTAGLVLDVRPKSAGPAIDLDLRISVSAPSGQETRSLSPGLPNRVQTFTTTAARVLTEVSVPEGGGVLLVSRWGGKTILFLATAASRTMK